MELRIIKTNEQHRRYLEEARRLAKGDPEPESNDGARLELLAKLIDDYERERFKFRKPDPVEAIVFRMAEQGLRQADIAAIVGGKNRASEILSRKRPLTLSMVRALTRSSVSRANFSFVSPLRNTGCARATASPRARSAGHEARAR